MQMRTTNRKKSCSFMWRGVIMEFLTSAIQDHNRPFYSCVLSYLATNASEAGVELALIQTSLLFSCKCQLVSITRFAQ